MTQVLLGVEIQGKTAQEVQQQVAKRSQAVVKLLKSRKVEKLQTTGISLNPNYSYKDGKPNITGYSGTNTVIRHSANSLLAINRFRIFQRFRMCPTQITAKSPKSNQIVTITIAAILLVGLP